MWEYYLGLYRQGTPFPERIVHVVLKVLEDVLPEFFPAKIATNMTTEATLRSAEEFDESMIMEELRNEESIFAEIYSHTGVGLSVLHEFNPRIVPSSVLIQWPDLVKLPSTKVFFKIIPALAKAVGADHALLTDSETPVRDDVKKRFFLIDTDLVPDALYWITWFGPRQVAAIGERPFAALATRFSVVPAAGGKLVCLQDEPYRDDNPEHVRRRLEAEELFGLTYLHRRFPDPLRAQAERP